MPFSFSCSKDNVLPGNLHHSCPQPLSRTVRASPSTAGQHKRFGSLSRNLLLHAKRFGEYTPSSSGDDTNKTPSQRPTSPAKIDDSVIAKYSGRAVVPDRPSSARPSSSRPSSRASSQRPSTSTPSQRPGTAKPPIDDSVIAKYSGRAVVPDRPASGAGRPSSSAPPRPSSSRRPERTVKVQQKGNNRGDAEQAVDDSAEAVQDGVDQAADAAQKGFDQFADGVSDAADQAQKNADRFERDAQGVVDDIEEVFDDAADQAAEQLNNVSEQVQSAAQGAIDSASNFADSLQKGAQSGSPYQQQPLSTLEANPFEGKSGKKPSAEVQRDYFKLRLMECIAGLDRGFAANSYAAMQVESAALALTEQSQPVMLSWTAESGEDDDKKDKESGLAQLSGTWRLVYSSGFSSGSIGGRQPGPSASLLPARLGQVYQIISPYTSRLDNVLELYTGLPGIEPVVLTASLKHHFEAVGGNIVQITFEDTEIKVTGGLGGLLGNLPEIMLPQLPEPFKPSRQQRTSSFDVLYLDSDLRITRGSRGELRIFVKT